MSATRWCVFLDTFYSCVVSSVAFMLGDCLPLLLLLLLPQLAWPFACSVT
jgi:hypothetical protein